MRYIFRLALIFFLSIKISAEPVEVSENKSVFHFGKNILILEDPKDELIFENILQEDIAENFHKMKEDVPTFGFSRSGYWAKFTVQNRSTYLDEYILEFEAPLADLVELY